MNLALVLFEYFPYGGLQRDMRAIADNARARGHTVTIFTRHWQGDRPDGIAVEILAAGGAGNHIRDERFVAAVAPRLADFDSVIGFNKMPGLDWYYAADGCLAARYRGLKRALARYRSKLAMERAVFRSSGTTRVLSISPPQRRLYQHCYATPDSRFVDLPPGIRRDRALPEDAPGHRQRLRQSLALGPDSPMLLFVGSGFRTKGLDRAIGALAALPDDACLYVVGDDRDRPYRRLAGKLGVAGRVHFMGGQDNVPEWLWSADLLLHPAYAENTGTVLLEAAIAGLPVLTTTACGYAPYIRDAALGTVLAAPSEPQLGEAARALLAQPRQQWRDRGRAFAARADIYDLVDHAMDAIERAPRDYSRRPSDKEGLQ